MFGGEIRYFFFFVLLYTSDKDLNQFHHLSSGRLLQLFNAVTTTERLHRKQEYSVKLKYLKIDSTSGYIFSSSPVCWIEIED